MIVRSEGGDWAMQPSSLLTTKSGCKQARGKRLPGQRFSRGWEDVAAIV